MFKFGVLFIGMKIGMPAGLTSLVLQSQVFFTILIAALLLGERPSRRGMLGLALAASGLVLIGLERPMGDSLLAFALVLVAALAWAFANIATKRAGATDMLRLICWVSLVPPLPLLALSCVRGAAGNGGGLRARHPGGLWLAAVRGLRCHHPGFAIWSFLLSRHPASLVTPSPSRCRSPGCCPAGCCWTRR